MVTSPISIPIPTGTSPTAVTNDVDASSLSSPSSSRLLRITCYGSSSAKTPEKYLKEAFSLGYTLAKRGHICVNGAGSYGCMAAMNDGAVAGNGHIIGVIHEMFLIDDGYNKYNNVNGIDSNNNNDDRKQKKKKNYVPFEGAHVAFQSSNDDNNNNNNLSPVIREILVAGGNDLQERKKLLVKNTCGICVLPGGPGTWDELWEMACEKHLGLLVDGNGVDLPIVCVNVDGYYDPFQQILINAYEDDLIHSSPSDIVHFEPTATDAITWIETQISLKKKQQQKHPAVKKEKPSASSKTLTTQNQRQQQRRSVLKRSSFFSSDVVLNDDDNDTDADDDRLVAEVDKLKKEDFFLTSSQLPSLFQAGIIFAIGVCIGTTFATTKVRK